MAKSLFDIAEEKIAEVSHNGTTAIVDLPTWWVCVAKAALMGTDEDVRSLCEGMTDDDLRAWFQAACAKTLIELRAAARPADFPASEGGGKRELMAPDGAGRLPQDRVDEYELKTLKRPGTGGSATKAAEKVWTATATALAATGMDAAAIAGILTASGAPAPRAQEIAEAATSN